MATWLVTGGTGFLGRHVVERLLRQGQAVWLLVRDPARHADRLAAFDALVAAGHGALTVVRGDVTLPGLGVGAALDGVALDHVLHLAAVYDLLAEEPTLQAVNVGGTAALLAWLRARGFGGVLHHVSSVAVAGDATGTFAEDDLERGQGFPHPYHRTKHDSERLVRESGLRTRIYRPSAIVGHSRTGEADRVDGPYFLMSPMKHLRYLLPGWVSLPGYLHGTLNMVPVDFVADALVHLARREGLDGRVFHLVDPDPPSIEATWNLLAEASGAPRIGRTYGAGGLDKVLPGLGTLIGSLGAVQGLRNAALEGLGVPTVVRDVKQFELRWETAATREALAGSGIACPPQEAYLPVLWDYWARHLDPDRAPALRWRRAVEGRRVLITGASSGVGAALAELCARNGAKVILVARRRDELEVVAARCRALGAEAAVHPCDLSDKDATDALVREVIAEHGGVDVLVNNAARSIRRAIAQSYDRLHDHERVIRLNHLAPVQLCLGFLPGMVERGHGHVVSVLTAGAHMPTPHFSAYVASKSALSAFTDTLAAEYLHHGVRATSAFLPWVKTPMMTATATYRSKAEGADVWTPERAAAWILDGIAERRRHLKTFATTRRFVENQLIPGFMTRALSYVFRVYDEHPERFPELEVDRKLFERWFKAPLV
jgi:short-subunit dehydrogenase